MGSHRSGKITAVDIAEYAARKIHKKVTKLAKKLKKSKKIERDLKMGAPVTLEIYSVKEEKRKQRKTADTRKLKKKREETAIKNAQREEAMASLDRERGRAEFQDWKNKEKEFLLFQSKARSEIRLSEGRIKPIDILLKHLDPSDVHIDLVIREPYEVFHSLRVKEIEELHEDIKLYLDLDRAISTRIQYWEALLVVCESELSKARKKVALDLARLRGEQPPVALLAEEWDMHSSIKADGKNFLQGKTYIELEALQSQIDSHMRSGTDNMEYWEPLLKLLHVYKAKACLKEIHTKMLRKRLEHLQQPLYDQPQFPKAILYDQPESPKAILYDKALLERELAAILEERKRRLQQALASRAVHESEDNIEDEGDESYGSHGGW